jgi:hypothetical protein
MMTSPFALMLGFKRILCTVRTAAKYRVMISEGDCPWLRNIDE